MDDLRRFSRNRGVRLASQLGQQLHLRRQREVAVEQQPPHSRQFFGERERQAHEAVHHVVGVAVRGQRGDQVLHELAVHERLHRGRHSVQHVAHRVRRHLHQQKAIHASEVALVGQSRSEHVLHHRLDLPAGQALYGHPPMNI